MILIKQSPPPIHIYAAIMRKNKRCSFGFASKTAEIFFLPQNIIFVYFFFTLVEIIVVRRKMRLDELIHSISHCIVENSEWTI